MKGLNKKNLLVNVVGMFLARAVFFTLNPVAIGFFAAAYVQKTTRVLLFIGISLGILTGMQIEEGIKYILIMAVIVVVTAVIEGKTKKISMTIMAVIAGIITTVFSITNAFLYANNNTQILLAILEGVLVFALTGVFNKGISYILYSKKGQVINNEEIISLSIIGALAVYVMPEINGLPFSFIETAAFFVVLFMGYKYGVGSGAVTGVACGIILELQRVGYQNLFLEGIQFEIIGTMCILGIIAGIFRETGKIGTSLAYGTGTICIGLMYQEQLFLRTGLSATISAIIIFVLLPRSIIYRTELVNRGEDNEMFIKENLQNIARKKLKEFSESFQKLSHTFNSISDTKMSLTRQDINQIFDELSDKLCKECKNCDTCWKSNFYDTYKSAFSIFSSAEKNGAVLASDVPSEFAVNCLNIDTFLAETNKSLAIAKLNLTWHNRMAESREAIAGQLCEVANIIDDFSADLYEAAKIESNLEEKITNGMKLNHIEVRKIAIYEKKNKRKEIYMTARTERGRCVTVREAAQIVSQIFGKRMCPCDSTKNIISKDFDTVAFVEDTNFKVLTGMARATKENEKVSGDNFSFLNLSNGEMVMTLSDGMGTGVKACEESESVINLLEQFMETGFKEESAIKLINSILVLKSESQSFSTIDMSVINLFTGLCEFIKIGASTTFIKRKDWVETISSTTLPVGVFNQVDFDGVTKKLYDGDYIVMVTDGVPDCVKNDKDEFMQNIILECTSSNPQEIANYILEAAVKENDYKAVDDMTVLVVGIWNK